jgi:hypothetical protein
MGPAADGRMGSVPGVTTAPVDPSIEPEPELQRPGLVAMDPATPTPQTDAIGKYDAVWREEGQRGEGACGDGRRVWREEGGNRSSTP